MAPELSLVITTYQNGRLSDASDLTKTIAQQHEPILEVTFVVEGSDTLVRDLESICRRNLSCNWKVILNRGKPGISASRNIGAKCSTGKVIAFVDDDVLLPQGWSQNLVASFSRPGVGAVTGGAAPLYVDIDATWLPLSLHWLIGSTAWYSLNFPSETRAVWGMNMAFQRAIFDRGIEFPEGIGGVQGRNIHGEEQVISYRIRKELGMKIVFDPGLAVLHKVYKFRLSALQIWKNSFGIGRSRRMVQRLYGRADALQVEHDLMRRIIRESLAKTIPELVFHPFRAVQTIYVTELCLAGVAMGYLTS